MSHRSESFVIVMEEVNTRISLSCRLSKFWRLILLYCLMFVYVGGGRGKGQRKKKRPTHSQLSDHRSCFRCSWIDLERYDWNLRIWKTKSNSANKAITLQTQSTLVVHTWVVPRCTHFIATMERFLNQSCSFYSNRKSVQGTVNIP